MSLPVSLRSVADGEPVVAGEVPQGSSGPIVRHAHTTLTVHLAGGTTLTSLGYKFNPDRNRSGTRFSERALVLSSGGNLNPDTFARLVDVNVFWQSKRLCTGQMG